MATRIQSEESMSTQPRPLTSLTQEEEMFRESVASFAAREVEPHVEEMDREQKLESSIIQRAFDMGLMGIEVPEQFGGSNSSFFNAILAVEELAVVDPSVSVFVDVQNTLVNNAVMRWGSDAQKEKYLPKLTSEWVAAYALSEPGSGSDAFALKTKAEDRGDNGDDQEEYGKSQHRRPPPESCYSAVVDSC